jgi:hypothetical protein
VLEQQRSELVSEVAVTVTAFGPINFHAEKLAMALR